MCGGRLLLCQRRQSSQSTLPNACHSRRSVSLDTERYFFDSLLLFDAQRPFCEAFSHWILCYSIPRRTQEQATRPADTGNDENRNADYAEDADFTDFLSASISPFRVIRVLFSEQSICVFYGAPLLVKLC